MRHTPDFTLPNGIMIECKERLLTLDRMKHRLIKLLHAQLDIRFVLRNPDAPIGPDSKTTYAQWCDKLGIKWSKGSIPQEWLGERA